jgi:hypothetical protein
MLVSLAILSIIAGSIAGAFGIGLRLLGPTGAPARLTGSSDVLAFEQQIGADVARATCMDSPGRSPDTPEQTTIPTLGGCPLSIANRPSTCGTEFSSGHPTGYLLCLAWYTPGQSVCHTVTYWEDAADVIQRSDFASGTTKTARFTTGGLLMTATWTPATTSNNTYLWTKQVNVLVQQKGTPNAAAVNPVSTTFKLVPLAADPLSPTVTSPC